jgi:arginyl-tRNA synthetase
LAVSIKDVAARAGVSIATVSHVLNGTRGTRPATRDRVLTAIQDLGYAQNQTARNLARGRSSLLGLIISDIRNPFFPEITSAFQDMALSRDMDAVVLNTNYDSLRTLNAVRRLIGLQVSGVAILTSQMEPAAAEMLPKAGIASVFLDLGLVDRNISDIAVDYEQGIGAALRHLTELGHQRIGYIGGPVQFPSVARRKTAFLDSAAQRGFEPCSVLDADFTVKGGYSACSALLQRECRPTAIVTGNDLTAIGVMHAAWDAGLRVPEQLSVVGFDDIVFSEYTQPALTTVAVPRKEIGTVAFEALWAMIEDPDHAGREYRMETRLVVRHSTAVPQPLRSLRWAGRQEGTESTGPSRYTQISVFHIQEKQIQTAFRDCVRAQFGLDVDVALEQPKQASFGELALPVAFSLAKALKQAPRKIAADLVAAVGAVPGVAAMEVAGNGYINVRFDRGAYGESLLHPEAERPAGAGGKTVVEHTNINPNKAAHIGHLRNAVLGDTFVRMLRALGEHVEVQNYIDNTGVQVADVVVGFHYLDRQTPAQVAQLMAQEDPDARPFDYVCWDLYALTSQYYKDNPDALAWRAETLHAIESGKGELAELAHLVADAIVNAHLATMLRLNIQYDVLPRESEILHLQFWAAAFALLKERKAIYFEEEGKNQGCWVMPSSAFRGEGDANEDSKVIVRSNGTVTYVGKDIAYQLWKFGLLGKDFYYKPLIRYTDGHEVWVSTDEPQPRPAPRFGNASQVFNVIDTRQSYLQDVVVAGLRALGFEEQAKQSVHFSYEMVALSPRCCADLGIELSPEDARRPYVDKLIESALGEVASRHPEDNQAAQRAVAVEIAMGALRYFLLKFTRNTVIAFDFQEALSFEGETGPYVQYAAVRAGRILKKLEERGETLPDFAAELSREAMARQLENEDCWQVLLAASKSGAALERAVTAGEPAHMARYAFQLAQEFSNFYQRFKVLDEPERERRIFLLWMTEFFALQLRRTLAILGIAVPAYM